LDADGPVGDEEVIVDRICDTPVSLSESSCFFLNIPPFLGFGNGRIVLADEVVEAEFSLELEVEATASEMITEFEVVESGGITAPIGAVGGVLIVSLLGSIVVAGSWL
jgi:hypothetical protein